jgi:hypothetical protein
MPELKTTPIYKTRERCAFDNDIAYSTINYYVRKGDIPLHFVNNKLLVEEGEVLHATAHVKRRHDDPRKHKPVAASEAARALLD